MINKINVGRTRPAYKIKNLKGKPYKGYVPRYSPAAVVAIREELTKIRKADLIEESDSPYASLMVCVQKLKGQL